MSLDPIEVTEDLSIVDGRHRKEGYELNRFTEVKVKVLEFDDETELIAYAYKKNTGGAKPPTVQDTEHTVMLLIERGCTKKAIGEHLGLPAGMARKYVTEVQSRMNRVKLQHAASAVTEGGLTVAKSAEMHDVDIEKLKEILSGRRRSIKQGVVEIQRAMTRTYKSVSQKNAQALRKLLEKYEDGDVTEKQMREIFAHLKNLQKQSSRAVADWEKRFEGMVPTKKNGKAA